MYATRMGQIPEHMELSSSAQRDYSFGDTLEIKIDAIMEGLDRIILIQLEYALLKAAGVVTHTMP